METPPLHNPNGIDRRGTLSPQGDVNFPPYSVTVSKYVWALRRAFSYQWLLFLKAPSISLPALAFGTLHPQAAYQSESNQN
jgi:hypothetical protein